MSPLQISPSYRSRNGCTSCDEYQPSSPPESYDGEKSLSSRGSTDDGTPATPVLSHGEIGSLKVYSSSVQYLTYQLFKNLHPELSTNGKTTSLPLNFKNPLSHKKLDGISTERPKVSFHSTDLIIHDTSETESLLRPNRAYTNHIKSHASEKQTIPIPKSMRNYPRRKRQSSQAFPDHTGL